MAPHLSDEQRAAVKHIAQSERLAIVRGIAGTGKTTMLSAAREAAEADDVRIVGAALSGKAARELEDGSGIPSRTLASWERSWAAGYEQLTRGDILIVDEAGMVGARQMGRVLEAVERAKAKLVLVGDERQLQPIEAGAAFRNIKDRVGERIGAVELTEVRRAQVDWQGEATQAFGRGDAAKALDAYRDRGEVVMHAGTDVSRDAMVKAHFAERDRANADRQNEGRGGSRSWPFGRRNRERPSVSAARAPDHILTAYRNTDVDALNDAVRAERIARSELGEGRPTGPIAVARTSPSAITSFSHAVAASVSPTAIAGSCSLLRTIGCPFGYGTVRRSRCPPTPTMACGAATPSPPIVPRA